MSTVDIFSPESAPLRALLERRNAEFRALVGGHLLDELDEAGVEHMEAMVETREARREADENPSVQAVLRWGNAYDHMVIAQERVEILKVRGEIRAELNAARGVPRVPYYLNH
ncbi:hypothetical protein ACFPTO_02100 [Paraburkholderia denitrificans]|uniref:Uncharacterized protein n=1 Tax=Paraburkholderia denitrificans TaxID=694025 RepID=A0ABW0J3K8_9BURK